MTTVGIIGAGAWGTALATAAVRAESETSIWCHEHEVAEDINMNHQNSLWLPGVKLDPAIHATTDIAKVCNSNIVVIATPAKFLRQTVNLMAANLHRDAYVLIASKGIENETGKLLSNVAKETLPDCGIGIISGPSFADEVANDMPTAVTLAAEMLPNAGWLARSFASKNFRVYASDDVIGTQIGGAVKNILAIASGIIVGLKLGKNAQAACITRGMAEISRLNMALGGKSETITGLSGLGDIWLTCSSEKSRNFSFGLEIGKGGNPKEILQKSQNAVEGAYTAAVIAEVAAKLKIEMPISEAVNNVIYHGANINDTVNALLNRPLKAEHHFGEL